MLIALQCVVECRMASLFLFHILCGVLVIGCVNACFPCKENYFCDTVTDNCHPCERYLMCDPIRARLFTDCKRHCPSVYKELMTTEDVNGVTTPDSIDVMTPDSIDVTPPVTSNLNKSIGTTHTANRQDTDKVKRFKISDDVMLICRLRHTSKDQARRQRKRRPRRQRQMQNGGDVL